jgi:hypothetical protein
MRIYHIFLIPDGPVSGEQVIYHILVISDGPVLREQVSMTAYRTPSQVRRNACSPPKKVA